MRDRAIQTHEARMSWLSIPSAQPWRAAMKVGGFLWLLVMHVGCFERKIGDSCAYTGGHEVTSCSEGVCVQDICREPAYLGDPCLDGFHCVEPEAHCYKAQRGDEAGTCRPFLLEGEVCRDPDMLCDGYQGLFCYRGVCTVPQPEGAGCRMALYSCQEGLYCMPPEGLPFKNLSTLDKETGICQPGQGEGGLCNIQLKVGCAEGYICSGTYLNTCQLEGTTI